MKKLALVVTIAAMVALNVQSATHEKVQLWEGGPYWATTNIGAEKPEDYGLYFWWGDTIGYKRVDNAWVASDGSTFNFEFSENSASGQTFNKSIATLQDEGWITADGILAPEHDAAHVKWGGGWRMPTTQELADLNSKCNWTRTTKNGVIGYVIRGRGDYTFASIFLPCAGFVSGTYLSSVGYSGEIWSSVAESDIKYARVLCFIPGEHYLAYPYCCNGLSIRPVQGFGEATDCIIHFNANGGTGTMAAQTFEDGKEQKLSKNTYSKDGYVFQGWAVAANGEVVYKDEASITVNSDMTLYAVWANLALTLTAESADWSSGSITMRCEDSDTSGAAHKYTLEYKNASGVWEEVDNAKNVAANKGQAASGQEVWIAKLTDTTFWSCLGGVPPVEYRVKEINNNRFSETCVTRMKYGIFVAPGSYSPSLLDGEGRHIESLLFMPNYASKFETLAGGRGKFVGKALTGNSATYKGLDDEFKIVAGQIKPGDVCFLYFGTHGGAGKNSTVSSLVLYDHFYSEQELAMHIKSLNAVSEHNPKGNGVAVVGFVHACHSGGIVDNSGDDDGVSGYCVPNAWCVNASLLAENVAWVTATDNSKSIAIGEFFSEFLLEYGWDNGWAGDSSDNALSCSELASYTMRQTNALFDGITFANEYGQAINVSAGVSDAHSILQHIVIGERGNHNGNQSAPSAPEITATGVDEHAIKITCQNIYNADAVAKFRRRGTVVSYEYWNGSIGTLHNGLTSELFDNDVANSSGDSPYYYQIRTYNGAGVGKSNVTYAWRVHTECPTVGFMYDVPGANYGGWQWTSTYGISLKDSGIWSAIGEKINELDTRGHTLLGWFTERGGKGTKISGETIAYSSTTYYGFWTAMPQDWLETHSAIATASGGDIVTAAAMTAANGCRTVGECYALGINPEDPNDDLKIADFKMEGGKPVITLNHTEDGSGNSFLPRVKTLGKADLSDATEEWRVVPEEGDQTMRFFKIDVEMP